MASLKCNTDFLSLLIKNKCIVYNFGSGTIKDLEINPKQSVNENSKIKDDVKENNHVYESVFLPCCDISSCGKWFVVSTNKKLLLWKVSDWSLIGTGILQRSPAKITFSPDANKIIVADKGGEVYIFLRESVSEPGNFLLGHLSLLFDVIITNDCKYVITCDRDEKIRVSCYPNAYNIVSYCLGHEEFVTCLKILPHCQNILVSASGDGTLKFWDFVRGKQLVSYLCSSDIDKKNFVNDIHDSVEHSAITKFEIFPIDNNKSVICALFDNYKGCILYNVQGTIDCNVNCCKLKVLSFECVIHDIAICKDLLWLFLNEEKDGLCVLRWNSVTCNFETIRSNDKINNAVSSVNRCLNGVKIKCRSSFSVLYKKQFDNIEEYYKRKRELNDRSLKKNKICD